MNSHVVPADVLSRLASLFDGTGVDPIGVTPASEFLKSGSPGSFTHWSLWFQRLYRYHDFCTLELSEVTDEGGKQILHLLVESRRHEALSIAYRIAGLAIDTADPDNKKVKELPVPVIKEELDISAGNLLVLFWAFTSEDERRAFIKEHCRQCTPGADTLNLLYDATPEAVLEPMGDPANALEDLAQELEVAGAMFARFIYPPLHPAAEYHVIASTEQSQEIETLPR